MQGEAAPSERRRHSSPEQRRNVLAELGGVGARVRRKNAKEPREEYEIVSASADYWVAIRSVTPVPRSRSRGMENTNPFDLEKSHGETNETRGEGSIDREQLLARHIQLEGELKDLNAWLATYAPSSPGYEERRTRREDILLIQKRINKTFQVWGGE